MQRDAHGHEFRQWKREVDSMWKGLFQQIDRMSDSPQRDSLELIREPWTTYLTHYAAFEGQSAT